MIIKRTENASRNLVFGTILKIYQLIVPFVMRTAIVHFLGMEYLGLNSLFYSILQFLNMAELGVSGAITFSMYKPIAQDDTKTICALMRLYKIYYRIIGVVVLIIGLCVLPFLPTLVSKDVPADINIYILYILNLAATVLSYWLFAYKTCLLNAHQRVDVTSKVTLITNTIQYLLQFLALMLLHNYYYYAVIALCIQALTNICSALVVNKMFPNYKANGNLTKDEVSTINKRIKDMFTSKIASTLSKSMDALVVSSFLGLTILALYNNYTYISTGIVGILGVIYTACSAGIGNSLVVETKEKNYKDLKRFTFIILSITGICTACLLCLYQPFMRLWMGPDSLLEMKIVICICINYFISELCRILSTYKDVAGMWHEDRFRPLVTAIANLVLSIVLVKELSLFGILLSANITTLLINLPWLINNLFKVLFSGYLKDYLKSLIKYAIQTMIICVLTFVVCDRISFGGIGEILLKGVVCAIIGVIVIIISNCKSEEFNGAMVLVKKVIVNVVKTR